MDNPGVSLFNNGQSLHVDAVRLQEAEEEEDEAEEQRRIKQELEANLHGAFDDLDLDETEDDDSIGSNYPQSILTPGQVPLKQLTSTPFPNNNIPHYQVPEGQKFHQLQVEETSIIEQDDTHNQHQNHQYDHQGVHGYGQGYQDMNGHQSNQLYAEGRDNLHQQQNEFNNKSDNEKVKQSEALYAEYVTRGAQINNLEAQIDTLRIEHAQQIRQLRQHLATTALEKEQQGTSVEQLEQLLADCRRENQLLKDEIHPLKERVTILEEAKHQLDLEHDSDKETIIQLRHKIVELEGADTVLRARQQYDALVRSLKERHDNEMQKLRLELDSANSAARDKEQDLISVRTKLTQSQNNYDFMLREKTSLIEQLNEKLNDNQRILLQHQSNSQALEIAKVKNSLQASEIRCERLEAELRGCKDKISDLQSEVAGYEAIGVGPDDLSESVIALGLGTSRSDGATRLKEELHRSLTSNKSKREHISALEKQITTKNDEIDQLHSTVTRLQDQLKDSNTRINEKSNESEELLQLRHETNNLKETNTKLENDLKHAQEQNVKVKKCMTELLEGNQEDKMEAIDSLRQEYEEHCRNAVEQTKNLMEGEVRRLNIELDVYNKTVLELRKKLESDSKKSQEETTKLLEDKIKELEKTIEVSLSEKSSMETKLRLVETEKDEIVKKLESVQKDLMEKEENLNGEITNKMESEIEIRIEEMRSQLRQVWENNRKGDIEEAVAAARLDWLKRLPEAEKPGGAARLSISQVEQLQSKLAEAAKQKEQLDLKLIAEKKISQSHINEIEKLRNDITSLRKEQLEIESRNHEELCKALSKQAEQWQQRVTTTRQHADNQHKQILARFDADRQELEARMKSREKETGELEAKLDTVEAEYSLAKDKWRRVLEDKNQTIQSLKKNNSGDVEILKAELSRRVDEIDRQRSEMTGMADRWAQEVKGIQATHQQEKMELQEMTEKYQNLKSKVRKYQRHVEQKENHYKQEYNRLETEFKCTLERLRERMELAYTTKEREVERELGNMRNQFTQELKNIATRKEKINMDGSPPPLTPTLPTATSPPTSLNNIEDQSLKQYYLKTSKEIQQLLK